MKHDVFVRTLQTAGDATITYKSANSGKSRYVVATMDFNNKYIESKKRPDLEGTEQGVLVFCWDSDSFKVINPGKVVSMIPLADTLKNPAP